jgi:hypothetical protein
MRRASIGCGAALLVLVCVFAGPVLAEAPAPPAATPAETRADELKARGDRALATGAYAEALAAYDEAYALRPVAALLYNRGRALQGLGRYAEALAQIEAFEDAAGPRLLARVPGLYQLKDDLRSHVATLTVTTDAPNARVAVGALSIAAGRAPAKLRLDAGPAHVVVTAPGYAQDARDLDLAAGGVVELDVHLAPVAAAPDEAAPSGVVGTWWFWTTVGVVVAGGAAVGIGVAAHHGGATPGNLPPGVVTLRAVRF